MLGLASVAALGLPPGSGWVCYGVSLGITLGHCGPSWAKLWQVGAEVGPSWATLAPSWGKLGLGWGYVEPSWGQDGAKLGPSWGQVGPSWGQVGAKLGQVGCQVGAKPGLGWILKVCVGVHCFSSVFFSMFLVGFSNVP